MDLHFTSEQMKILLMLLQKEETTLQVEINHTFHREFKTVLKERLKEITKLIEQLKVNELNLI